jgi:phosphoglycolate phosphatase
MTTLLFDLDGTLLETHLGILNTFSHTLEKLILPAKTEAELRQYIGPPLHNVFRELVGESLVDKALDVYRQRYNTLGKLEAKHYDGMPETLEQLHQNYQLIVATSKRTQLAEDMIKHFGFAAFFHAVYGSPDIPETKTELISRILQDVGLESSSVVMIGDRQFDMTGAKDNGVYAVGALWGYGSEAELLESGATVVCNEPRELLDVLESW